MKATRGTLLQCLPYVAILGLIWATIAADLPGLRLRESGGCAVLGTQQAVGGISVDARGVISRSQTDDSRRLRDELTRTLASLNQPNPDLRQPTELRKVSLRALQAALKAKLEANQPIPEEMDVLAGLQTIRYVFVYPEQNDVVLAGFGEGWRVDDQGYVVGVTTGRPVLLLDDLLVALRNAFQSKGEAVTCSIDPTKDGLERLQGFVKTLTTAGNNRAALEASIADQLGPQAVTIRGVPSSSHLARVLVAADYKMKRIAMAIDKSPVAGLQSYTSMLSGAGRGLSNMLPRWWITTNYNPLNHDADKLAWELSGPGVKTMAEEDYLQTDGTLQRGVRRGGNTQRWADQMTAKYDELALKDPIFGQLRGVMDLSVVAALIRSEALDTRAGLDLRTLLDDAPTTPFPTPSQVPTIAQSMNKGTSVVLTASGGVSISPFAVIRERQVGEHTAAARSTAARQAPSDRWWWN